MRDRLIGELGELAHSRFLVYLMGPYKTFDVDALLDAAETDNREALSSIPEAVDFGALVGSEVDLDQQEAVLDLLLYARDRLRTEPGVNAFLAIDIDIPLEEMDAATQSIEFALASNAVIYIVPRIGDNLGVGIETGSVLEAIFRECDERTPTSAHQERVLFIHESGVRSAMIAAVQDRWDARIYSYDDRNRVDRQIWEVLSRDIRRVALRGLRRCRQLAHSWFRSAFAGRPQRTAAVGST